jgi:superfamily I DNA and/or RNA helicase
MLHNARIILTTLSMSGVSIFKKMPKPDFLIIDEACQSIEPETLIPFEFDPKRVILIGD